MRRSVIRFQPARQTGEAASIDRGEQFLALQVRRQAPDDRRQLVVDDNEAARQAFAAMGVTPRPGRFLDFRDPWGNRFEFVCYGSIQISTAPNVRRGIELTHLVEAPTAIEELDDKAAARPDARKSRSSRNMALSLHQAGERSIRAFDAWSCFHLPV